MTFQDTIDQAQQIADKAVRKAYDKLLLAGPKYRVGNDYLLDDCGYAQIRFRNKNKAFYRRYKEFVLSQGGEDPRGFWQHTSFGATQLYSVNRAAAQATADYLNTLGADVEAYFYYD